MKSVNSKIILTRQQLVSTAESSAVQIESGDLADFMAYSPSYTSELPSLIRTKADAVAALKSIRGRKTEFKEAYFEMETMVPDLLLKARNVVGYIRKAFPANQVSARIDQSGYTAYYSDAMQNNWPAVQNLCTNMITFIQNHKDVLESTKAMPSNFLASFTKAYDDFNAAYTDAQVARTKQTAETNAYNLAINDLNDVLSTLFFDAQTIYRNDAVKRSFYTMTSFDRQLRPNKPAGFRFHLMDEISKLPIAGAVVTMPYHDIVETTDAKGRFVRTGIQEGTYQVTIKAKNYATVVLESVKVKPRIVTRVGTLLMSRMETPTKETSPKVAVVDEEKAEKSDTPNVEENAEKLVEAPPKSVSDGSSNGQL